MKNKVYIIFLLVSVVSFGQRKFAADRYFKDLAYVKSAKLYKDIYQKGDTSKLVIKRLADSYYLNNKTEEAEKWYTKLFTLYSKDTIDIESYFRYAQSLKINGNYKESDKWLLKFRTKNNQDSRGLKLIEQKNYLENFATDKNQYRSVHNLSINSKYSDYGGFVINDTVYFSSTRPRTFNSIEKKYHWNHKPFYNIYKAKVVRFDNEKNISFTDLENVKKLKGVNTKYHDANAVITKDGKTMYFNKDNGFKRRRLNKENLIRLKLFKAEKVNGEWKNIKELPFNSNDFSSGHPALSPDEKTLYFTSDRPGGFGEEDIYQVSINENGTYGEPKNLGKEINTEGIEMFPFMTKDSTLFFSSNGHIGLGGLDVFKSNLISDTFQKPTNLGAPLNSKLDDFSFIIKEDENIGFVCSNREGGKGDDDIYSFERFKAITPVKVVEDCKQFVKGYVSNSKTGERIPDVTITLYNEKDVKLSQTQSKINGDYAFNFDLGCSKKHYIKIEKTGYNPNQKIFVTSSISAETVVPLDIETIDELIVEDNGLLKIKIGIIYFDLDKFFIRDDSANELNKIVVLMTKYPKMVINIESHTDSRSKDEYNLELSNNRAQATRKYIISKGISPNRINNAAGFGETQLINKCSNGVTCTEAQHQLNRRSEFIILKI